MDLPAHEPVAELPAMELAALLSPQVDPLFWRPTRLDVDSAWYGHLPFAHWIVYATRPRVLVELGTHAGVSYSAFCEAVARARLDTRCFAVDTWAGDEHAGFYGEEVYADLLKFHDSRYAAFSQLLRCTFDAALPYLPDGSVDLLHIDGRHSYADVAHDFAGWTPKLSSRAVVLFHDTNVRERDFGVWRLWAELRQRHPSFEFLHEHGLGVLAYGADAPAAVQALCRASAGAEGAASDGAAAQFRERFTLLGERWMMQSAQTKMERAVAVSQRHAADMERDFHIIEEYSRALGGGGFPPSPDTVAALRATARSATARAVASELQARHEAARAATLAAAAAELQDRCQRSETAGEAASVRAAAAEARMHEALRALAAAEATVADGRAETAALRYHRDVLVASTSWRVTAPLRTALNVVRPPARTAAPSALKPAPPRPEPAPVAATVAVDVPPPVVAAAAPPRPRALFVGGEADTPGMQYRCVRYAEAATAAGWDAQAKPLAEVTDADLLGTDLVMLWRAALTPEVARVIARVRQLGGRLGFDLDDMMHRPELARIEVIDGIRTIQASESGTAEFYGRIAQTLDQCDFCSATTAELAASLRSWRRATYVLPNGFDEPTLRAARLAARRRQAAPGDGLVRLGYASGSRTHQKDFAVIAGAVAAVLRARPDTRLVLFRSAQDGIGVVLADEFAELAELGDRIEWRDLVPLAELPHELARFDVNLVPLQVGNPFVEAKSELKYFEAALAGACSVASPTGPYRRAIAHGETGFLAATAAEWELTLLRLVDDPRLRAEVAQAALLDVLWRFGPQRRCALMRDFLPVHHDGDPSQAARAFAATLGGDAAPASRPVVNPTETLFRHDALGEAAVTVAVTLYNYAEFVLEALESVRLQTLSPLDLVVVDDCSTDPAGLELALDWAQTHAARFNRLLVLRHHRNAGLGGARNAGFAAAETPWVLPLDADNRLRPACAERLLAHATDKAAFVYPQLQQFGDARAVFSGQRWEPQRLVGSNYIDALALVGKWAWAAAGGYYVRRDVMGWEDYDLWCRLAELGQHGVAAPEVLAEYRVHGSSMIDSTMETDGIKERMVDFIEGRHRWLDVLARKAELRGG